MDDDAAGDGVAAGGVAAGGVAGAADAADAAGAAGQWIIVDLAFGMARHQPILLHGAGCIRGASILGSLTGAGVRGIGQDHQEDQDYGANQATKTSAAAQFHVCSIPGISLRVLANPTSGAP
jgi:hypothetical protein